MPEEAQGCDLRLRRGPAWYISRAMRTRLFLPESRLEAWIAAGKAELGESGITLQDEGAPIPLVGAVHVRSLVEGEDRMDWLGKVKEEGVLRAAGAELLGETMVVGETAYEIVRGFLLEIGEEGEGGTRSYLEAE